MTTICHAAAEYLELQYYREYWSETEEGYRATAIRRLRPEEKANLPTENFQAEKYLTKFGIIASVSGRKSNCFFKAKRIKDDLMLNCEGKEKSQVNSSAERKLYRPRPNGE